MAAPQPLLVDELLPQIRAFISRTNPSASAVLLLNICVEGTDERETFRISVPRDSDDESTPCSSSSPTSLSSTRSSDEQASSDNNDDDRDDEAVRLQNLALNDVAPASSTDGRIVRHSHRTRMPVQRLDRLVAASSHPPPRTNRKRPAASTEQDDEDVDSAEEDEEEDTTAQTSKRVVRSYSKPTLRPNRNKRQQRSTDRPQAVPSGEDEVAVLVAKLRAACSRQLSTEAVSTAVIARLGREVLILNGDGGTEERCLTDVADKIAVLISTSAALRMVGYYLRSVLAVRLKATHRTKFTEAARRLLGIKSTADIATYPAFHAFVQQHCPSVARARDVMDVEAWLKEPVLVAEISWTAWRRYLCKPNRWMLDRAMKESSGMIMSPSSSLASPSSTSSTLLSLGSASSNTDNVDDVLSFSDVEVDSEASDTSDTPQRPRRKRAKPVWTAAMTVSGHVLDAATNSKLQMLRREHHRLTKDIWNSHSYQLAEHDEDVVVGTTNGEMRQAPFCELLQTLMAHPSIPLHARLQSQSQSQLAGADHFWLDVGSGYGLPVLRTRIVTGAKVCAGIEIAEDRVSISHRLAGQLGMQDQVHFVSSDVCHPQVLPILLAATHLFVFSAVFSVDTQDYLASVLSRPDSSWLLYVACDKTDSLARAGITVHTEPHGPDCRLGGVHLLGRTRPLPMSVSKQSFSACIYLRCIPASAGVRAAAWATGMATLLERSAAAALRASEEMSRTLTSSERRETRSTRQSASSSTG